MSELTSVIEKLEIRIDETQKTSKEEAKTDEMVNFFRSFN